MVTAKRPVALTVRPFMSILFANRHSTDYETEPSYPDLRSAIHTLISRTGMGVGELASKLGVATNLLNQVMFTSRSLATEHYQTLAGIATEFSLYKMAEWFSDHYQTRIHRPNRGRQRVNDEG
jgi:hypothetical protein